MSVRDLDDYLRHIQNNMHPSFIKNIAKEMQEKDKEIEKYKSIIKEVREYITSYESIDIIQQNEHSENNKDLDEKTLNEMVRRYLIVHDKLLEILDKESK